MARYFFDTDMPEDEPEFIRRMLEVHAEGVEVGRVQGAKEIVDRVEEWVRDKYYSDDVKRGTPYAQDILDLAASLVHGLIHGDLGKIETKGDDN